MAENMTLTRLLQLLMAKESEETDKVTQHARQQVPAIPSSATVKHALGYSIRLPHAWVM